MIDVELHEGFHSWVLPTGYIKTFHIGSTQTVVLSFDAGEGVYTLISPEGTSTYTHNEAPQNVDAPSPTVIPTICGPGDLIIMEHLPIGAIVSYWGNLTIVPETGEIRALSPESPGTYAIAINGGAFASIVVVHAIKNNAKVDCSGIAEPVTYSVEVYPTNIKYDGTAIVTICARNPNNVTADASVEKLQLPQWLISSPPLEIPSFTLAPLAQACRSFVLTANSASTDSQEFNISVNNVSSTLTVAARPAPPEVVFEYLKSSNSKVRVGASYYVEGLVRNKTKSQVTVTLSQLTTTLVRVEGERSISVDIPAFGHHTFRFYCIAETAGTASITIPAGALLAVANGTSVQISGNKSVSITQIP